jgi:hypothetical protein
MRVPTSIRRWSAMIALGLAITGATAQVPTPPALKAAAASEGNTGIKPMEMSSQDVPEAFAGLPYHSAIRMQGGIAPYRVSITGDFPPGIFYEPGFNVVTFSGIPTTSGTFNSQVTLTDINGVTISHDYTFVVHAATLHPELVTVPISLAEHMTIADTSHVFFPAVLNLDEKMTMTDSFTDFFALMPHLNENMTMTDTIAIKLSLGVAPATIPAGTINVPYSQTFTAAGNTGSTTITPSGSLPAGMCFSVTFTCPTTRQIYGAVLHLLGTPTQTGSFNFTLTATDTANTSVIPFTLVIAGVSQNITVGALPSPVYGGSSFALSATSTSGLPVTITSTSSRATGSNPFAPAAAGTATFQATQPGNANYDPATPVNFNVKISPAVLTVAAHSATRKFDQPNPSFQSSITGDVNDDLSTVVTGTPVIATTATSLSPVSGSPYAITPTTNNLSAANYTFQPVNGSLTITPDTQYITFLKVPNLTIGSNFPLTAVASSGLPVTYTVTGPAVISNNILGIIGTGLVTVTANQAGNTNYSAATAVVRSFDAQ